MIVSTHQYPDKALVAKGFHLPIAHRFRHFADEVRLPSNKTIKDIQVWPLRGRIRDLAKYDFPVVMLTNNSRRFLPSLLEHYRQLGATRFLVLDDQSTDGTREYLERCADVDIFLSNVRYAAAHRGRAWREALFEMHGPDRWYLNIDCDEYFVFDSFETRTIGHLARELERRGVYRCAAPMVDCYPEGKLHDAKFDGDTAAMPWTVAKMFDRSGYKLVVGRRALSLEGGVRARVFGAVAELMKYPFLYWRRGYSLATSIHQPAPFKLNFGPIYGTLLHFKFFDDVAERARAAIADNQYYDGAREYRRIASALSTEAEAILDSDISIPFKGPGDMIDHGFFASVF
jgi:hypothetical protein